MIDEIEYSQLFGNSVAIKFYSGKWYLGIYNSDDEKLYVSKYVKKKKTKSLSLEIIKLLKQNNLNIKQII